MNLDFPAPAGTESWEQRGQGTTYNMRLRDGTFTHADQPQSIMWCGGFGSADWFQNDIEQLTFDVGTGNPGAIGLPSSMPRNPGRV